MSRVLVLIATIPPRRSSCERLLLELTKQSRVPDGVILRLDGYGDAPAPRCPLPLLATSRTAQLSGPGPRWLFAHAVCDRDNIVANLDDDVYTRRAPDLIKALVAGVEECGAAAALGRTLDGRRAPPGKVARKTPLIYAAGCGLALRAGHLQGLQELADEVKAAGGPDALGVCGDDDALLSALLWRKGIKIRHAATGVINCAAGTQASSQTKLRAARGEKPDVQKLAIARNTGWPWPGSKLAISEPG